MDIGAKIGHPAYFDIVASHTRPEPVIGARNICQFRAVNSCNAPGDSLFVLTPVASQVFNISGIEIVEVEIEESV
jgi:hypothetical protein